MRLAKSARGNVCLGEQTALQRNWGRVTGGGGMCGKGGNMAKKANIMAGQLDNADRLSSGFVKLADRTPCCLLRVYASQMVEL
jgi:hypothetical protein